ncbi:hypothetical protein [Synechococcus elongatus]|uniref:Uncharacterized protein n=1 Tax=Synechococcus elongatus (strain ATCC 33912 / PCC 7942 / FACHB-805) TaxID=1140 RepID=Q31QK8_SYNE7|nr:hypothetical protein [Synechococcus elongatus]ABB56661.1 hypothetical protein Synpcc7942_0629 [Synechococcus elongatus PCC 7942 = FACHB-805]MBD2589005.1 hypothetical protein [Synechococcus elongatus FACHB-242]MBD2690071.1 hypothetical protein [Synechococcus elongatus FACHB-1061]MBD2708514.1 hypothetical protein [Synechococcus elongatus PCC 7942 = FACHB-805]UOW70421.1 hypothetical protein PCC7943_0656 [Synechococcus elongatus PCC 7943]
MDWLLAGWPTPLLEIAIAAAIVHCAAGLWATAIATRKGHRAGQWLLIGLIGGSFAVLLSRRLSDRTNP